jgi:hypothetical protein
MTQKAEYQKKNSRPFDLPISSTALAWSRRDASQQSTTTKLLFNMGIKFTALLALLNLPDNMLTLLGFLCSSFSFLLSDMMELVISKYYNINYKNRWTERNITWHYAREINLTYSTEMYSS